MTIEATGIQAKRGIWGRQLDHYPSTGPRTAYLAIVVLATITLYYELYVQGSVATALAANLHMTLVYLISISIVGNGVGALASVVVGLADRWGRSNLVVYGLAVTGALVLFGLANATDKWVYLILFAVVSFVEGMILVATPALIRDFSPQLGRASAMCFWTMGPVLGSLVVSEVASHTLDSHPDWQYQFRICGIVGIAMAVVAFVGLRELAPQLRDQLMVSLRETTLIEANARGIDPDEALSGHWRQMLRRDIIGPAIAISVFLLFYYIAAGLFVVYYATNFGYSEARANALSNWYWGVNALALLAAGLLSDWLKVRKPFMILGGVASAVGVAFFAIATTHPSTGYYAFVGILIPISAGGAFAFAAWMAAFTETVEKHNPAATATGLAVWGATLRTVVVVALLVLIAVIPAASNLVGQGTQVAAAAAGQTPGLTTSENATVKAVAADPTIATRVQTIATTDAAQLATAQAIDASTQAALQANPANTTALTTAVTEIATKFSIPATEAAARLQALAAVPTSDLALVATYGPGLQDPKVVAELKYLQANAPAVEQAAKQSPIQWQRWWWICFAAQLFFLPFTWLLTGRWSPKKAAQDAREHAEKVDEQLAALSVVTAE